MPPYEAQHQLGLLGIVERTQPNHFQIAIGFQLALLIQHIGNAARHAGREVASRGTQDDHPATRHVLASVIAHPLHHRVRAAVAHAETLAHQAANVGLAAGGAIERDIAGDHVLPGRKAGIERRAQNELSA